MPMKILHSINVREESTGYRIYYQQLIQYIALIMNVFSNLYDLAWGFESSSCYIGSRENHLKSLVMWQVYYNIKHDTVLLQGSINCNHL